MITSKQIIKISEKYSDSFMLESYATVKEAFEKLSTKEFIAYLSQLGLPLLRQEPIFKQLSQSKVEILLNDSLNKAIYIEYKTDVTNNNETFILDVNLSYHISHQTIYLSSYINDKKTGQRNTLVRGQIVPNDKSVSSVQSMITKQAKKMTEKYNKLMTMPIRKYYW